MTKLVLISALALCLPGAARACAACDESQHAHAHASSAPAAAPAPLAQGEARFTIPVAGMSCSHCASRVQTALTKVEGVKSADAILEKGQAIVTVEKGKVDPAKLVAAIDAAGYKAGTPVQD